MPERKGHETPCDAMRVAQIAIGVMDTRLGIHEGWKRDQNGSLEKLATRMEDMVTVEIARHDENRAAIIRAKEDITQLRWQMRLGFLSLGLILVSGHPMFANVLRLLGM